MTAPAIRGKAVTSSRLLQVLADDLSRIKSEDGLRWVDIGEVLGRSDDQAAKYADGSATMDFIAFQRGRIAWGGRFSGSIDKLVQESSPEQDGQATQSLLLKAALGLSVALEDGTLTNDEIRANRPTLEQSLDAIRGLLARIAPPDER